ncbi:MAG: sigma factor-like helix-turn-helix DNA-binding protein [Actinomycetota bacterium]
MISSWSSVAQVGAPDPLSLDAPVGEGTGVSLGDLLVDRTAASPFDQVVSRLVSEEVHRLIGRLEDRERRVVELRFGLGGAEPLTLDATGRQLGGLSRERVRQIELGALAKLRHACAASESGALVAG